MKQQEKKKQIYLEQGYNDLQGKIVDKVSLYSDHGNCESGELLITFTDDTYILVSPQYEEDLDLAVLHNDHVQVLNEHSSKPGYVIDDKFRWNQQFQRYIDCGIIEFDPDLIKSWIDAEQKRKATLEYEQYLRLKAKFEP